MKFIILAISIILVTNVYSGKVKWDKNGNPILEKPTSPIKGCQKQTLDNILEDNNSSKCKK